MLKEYLYLLALIAVLCLAEDDLLKHRVKRSEINNKGLDFLSTVTNDRFIYLFNQHCKETVLQNVQQLIDLERIRFQYITPNENFNFLVSEAQRLWRHPSFLKNERIIIFCTGWRNGPEMTDPLKVLSAAFMSRRDVNFVAVDLDSQLNTINSWANLNVDAVGEYIAHSLLKLLYVDKVHLIGHSLGAHVMGAVGREFTKITGRKLPRITGLDPSNACHQYQNIFRLRKTDADIVDVIHTNIDVLGISQPVGTVDFYTGLIKYPQPGCVKIGCSHARAVDYFAESVIWSQERNFNAFRCNTWKDLELSTCSTTPSAVMGYKLDPSSKGSFHVKVNYKSPFGTNSQ